MSDFVSKKSMVSRGPIFAVRDDGEKIVIEPLTREAGEIADRLRKRNVSVAKCVAFRALMFEGLEGTALARMHEVTLEVIAERLAPVLCARPDDMDDLVPAVLKAESASRGA